MQLQHEHVELQLVLDVELLRMLELQLQQHQLNEQQPPGQVRASARGADGPDRSTRDRPGAGERRNHMSLAQELMTLESTTFELDEISDLGQDAAGWCSSSCSCSSSGIAIMMTSHQAAASAMPITWMPASSAFLAEAEPGRSAAARFFTPESRMLSACACHWLP